MYLNGKKMLDRYDQVEFYTPNEYKRRHNVVRKVMKDEGVDLLLVLDLTQEGTDQWMTGKRHLECMIVPNEGKMTAVLWNEHDESVYPAADITDYSRYVNQRRVYKNSDDVDFINNPGPAGIAKIIAKYAPKTIGVVMPAAMTVALQSAINDAVPGVEIKNVTLAFEVAKAYKSDEEMAVIMESIHIQERILEALPLIIRIGRTPADVTRDILKMLQDQGGNGFLHDGLMFAGKQDEARSFGDSSNKTIEYGDRFFALFEANGFGYHHTALGRHYIIGEPRKNFVDAVRTAAELNQFASTMMKPGVTLHQIVDATEELAKEKNVEIKEMCWMHGLGGFYYEQFAVKDTAYDAPLCDHTILHCHPVIGRIHEDGKTKEDVFVLNTYLTTPEGGKSLLSLPTDIKVLY